MLAAADSEASPFGGHRGGREEEEGEKGKE